MNLFCAKLVRWTLPGIALVVLLTAPASADKADRLLRRQASSLEQLRKDVTPRLSQQDTDRLLRSVARYRTVVRNAILNTAGAVAAGETTDIAAHLRAQIPEHLAPQGEAGEILAAFPELTKTLGQMARQHPDLLEQTLKTYGRALQIIDKKAHQAWVKKLRNSRAALSQLVDVSKFFRDEFEYTRQLRATYMAKIEEKKQLAREIEAMQKGPSVMTVVVVSDPYAYHSRHPYYSGAVGYPYDAYSAYAWTRSPTVPYYGFTGNPYAGIDKLKQKLIGIWQLPSYQVVQYVLAQADMYPDLADAMLSLYETTRTPETFRGAVQGWLDANQLDPDSDWMNKKGRRDRLVTQARQRKRAFVDQAASSAAVKCPPGQNKNADEGGCPEAIFERYLAPRADARMQAPDDLEIDQDVVEHDRFVRVRNVHAALWSGIAAQQAR